MKFFKIIIFFFNQTKKKIWVYILLNYFIVLLISFSEIIFIGIFYLLLNKKAGSSTLDFFLNKLDILNNKFFTDFEQNKFYILLLIFFLFLKNILFLFQCYFYQRFIHNIVLNKSSEILGTLFNLDFESFNKKEISIYIKEIIKDVESVFLSIFGNIISIFSEITYIILLLFYLHYLIIFSFNFEIIILFFILIFIVYYLFKASEKLGILRAINEIKTFKTLSDTLSIFRELKLNNQSKQFIDRYKKFLHNYYLSKLYHGLINIAPKFILEFFCIIFFFILYKESSLDITQFFLKFSVLALAMFRLIPSFSRLSTYITTALYNFQSIQAIRYNLNKNIKFVPKKAEYKIINNIKLKNISLSYYSITESRSFKIFNNFNLYLKKNNIYGIYGASGTGKTTLLNTLIGFVKPQKGTIYYNNKKQIFNEISNNFNISFLQQNPTILDENIIINSTLKFSNSIKEINKIKFYLEKFNLNKFLNKKFITDNNIESIKSMSGGEKQRIAFVRSIINNPDLLILDEPVSSLDPKNAQKIFNFLRNYKKDRIIIVTSHKNSEKKFFDKVIYL